jgi:hypothetical protein
MEGCEMKMKKLVVLLSTVFLVLVLGCGDTREKLAIDIVKNSNAGKFTEANCASKGASTKWEAEKKEGDVYIVTVWMKQNTVIGYNEFKVNISTGKWSFSDWGFGDKKK